MIPVIGGEHTLMIINNSHTDNKRPQGTKKLPKQGQFRSLKKLNKYSIEKNLQTTGSTYRQKSEDLLWSVIA